MVENTATGPRCVDLRLVARSGGEPITTVGLRALSVARIVAGIDRQQLVLHRTPGGAWAGSGGEQSSRDRAAYRRALKRRDAAERRWLLDAYLLVRVAEVYRTAGLAPTQAVADEFGINRGRAGRWVKVARERGHLGPAPAERMKGERLR